MQNGFRQRAAFEDGKINIFHSSSQRGKGDFICRVGLGGSRLYAGGAQLSDRSTARRLKRFLTQEKHSLLPWS